MGHVMQNRGSVEVDLEDNKNRLPIHATKYNLGVLRALMGIDVPPSGWVAAS